MFKKADYSYFYQLTKNEALPKKPKSSNRQIFLLRFYCKSAFVCDIFVKFKYKGLLSSGILRDKTMDNTLIYTLNYYKPFIYLEKFGH